MNESTILWGSSDEFTIFYNRIDDWIKITVSCSPPHLTPSSCTPLATARRAAANFMLIGQHSCWSHSECLILYWKCQSISHCRPSLYFPWPTIWRSCPITFDRSDVCEMKSNLSSVCDYHYDSLMLMSIHPFHEIDEIYVCCAIWTQ
jgi:hypothetical protein